MVRGRVRLRGRVKVWVRVWVWVRVRGRVRVRVGVRVRIRGASPESCRSVRSRAAQILSATSEAAPALAWMSSSRLACSRSAASSRS